VSSADAIPTGAALDELDVVAGAAIAPIMPLVASRITSAIAIARHAPPVGVPL
jgi:hypothetical protein